MDVSGGMAVDALQDVDQIVAIEAFGFQEVRLIDPKCGSGHFLLTAFHRLFELWAAREPGTNPRALAQRALD